MSKKESKETEAGNSEEKLNELNDLIKKVMGKRTSSSIAKECGVSVSTITRIRNGENKRGVRDKTLRQIWNCRDKNCDIDINTLLDANDAVTEAFDKKSDAEYRQEQEELDLLVRQIPNQLLNSGYFVRKISEDIEIIPGETFYPDFAYEVDFGNGDKRRLLFITQFFLKSRIGYFENRYENGEQPNYRAIYRSVLDFQEVRTSHPENESAELVLVFNYEGAFRHNVAALGSLSNKSNVTLALMDPVSRRFKEEVRLDGTQETVLHPLFKFC